MAKSLSYPKNKIKVLLLDNVNQQAVDLFKKEGYNVEALSRGLSEKELREKISDVFILGIRSKTSVTKNVLESAKKLLAIGRFGIGVNNIDISESSKKGVAVFNAPFSSTRSVVELVLGNIIMLYRKAFDKSMKLHNGIWDKSSANCNEVRGKKLGIIGYGNIGTQLSVLAESLGMQVYFYDIMDKPAWGNATKCTSLEELLKISDVVTVHSDAKKANTHLIGKKEFKIMKDGVIFLNLSRASVVDTDALVENIKKGKIAGAAIDVFDSEPKGNNEPFSSKLRGLPNIILTPHIGGNTEEAQKNIGDFVSNKMITFVNTGNTMMSVNFPNLMLPDQINTHRFIHIHTNIPGILAKINSVLADHNINIEGQYLKTTESIGYVISDVSTKYEQRVIQALREIPGTIRVRVLY